MPGRDASFVIRHARIRLRNVELGIEALEGPDPDRQAAGMHDVAIHGRAVTNIVQGLRDVDRERFDTWYAPQVEAMQNDELLRFFYGLRTEFLKVGGPELDRQTEATPGEWLELQNPPPEALLASGFDDEEDQPNPFHIGGAAWAISSAPDGQRRVFLIAPTTTSTTLTLPNPPARHLGVDLASRDAITLSKLYLAYLTGLVEAAAAEFLANG